MPAGQELDEDGDHDTVLPNTCRVWEPHIFHRQGHLNQGVPIRRDQRLMGPLECFGVSVRSMFGSIRGQAGGGLLRGTGEHSAVKILQSVRQAHGTLDGLRVLKLWGCVAAPAPRQGRPTWATTSVASWASPPFPPALRSRSSDATGGIGRKPALVSHATLGAEAVSATIVGWPALMRPRSPTLRSTAPVVPEATDT
jgi:hypothetical protein